MTEHHSGVSSDDCPSAGHTQLARRNRLQTAREWLLSAVQRALGRPLLLVVDDLHWVDEASADVLWFVTSRIEDLPVQMAAAERVAPDGLPLRRASCPPPLLVVRLDPVAAPHLAAPDPRHEPGLRLGSGGPPEPPGNHNQPKRGRMYRAGVRRSADIEGRDGNLLRITPALPTTTVLTRRREKEP